MSTDPMAGAISKGGNNLSWMQSFKQLVGMGGKEPQIPGTDTHGEGEKIVALINEMYENYPERRGLREKWMRALQFYQGYQWHKWSYDTGRIEERMNPGRKKVRLTINRFYDAVRTFAAKLMKQKPAIFVVPATQDEHDQNAARIAQSVIDALWLDLHIQKRLRECSKGIPLFGNMFIGVEWDYVKDNFCVEAGSPFEFTLDWDCDSLEAARRILRTKVVDKARLPEMFPKGPMMDGKTPVSKAASETASIVDAFQAATGIQNAKPSQSRDKVLVHYYYERPSKEHDKGIRAVVADGNLYELGDNDLLPDGDLPFVHFTDIVSPGFFWAQGTGEHLIELQYTYNKVRSLKLQSLGLTAWPKVCVFEGSPAAADNAFTNEPGEKITVQAGQLPFFLQPGNISGDADTELSLIVQDIEAVSGQHETTRTSAPPGDVASGIAIQQLLEMDESRMADTFASWEEGIERLAKMLIEVAKTRYGDKRTAAIVGRNMEVEYLDYQASDLYGNYDIRVQSGSSLPQSKTARQQLVLDLHQRGLITDPEIVLDLLDMGQMQTYWDYRRLDRHRQQMENRFLKHGRWFAPSDYDNHKIHIEEIDRFQKSDEFLQFPQPIQELFAKHKNEHGMFLLKLADALNPKQSSGAGEAAATPPPSVELSPETGQAAEATASPTPETSQGGQVNAQP